MMRAYPCSRVVCLCLWASAAALLAPFAAWSQEEPPDWQVQVREKVRLHQLDAALTVVDRRLQQDDSDMEAHGWRGRLLAWRGEWSSAEAEYRLALLHAPNDTDVLCGLADVLLWQGKPKEALTFADRAHNLDPTGIEILFRRARILTASGKTSEARTQYREILRMYPDNQEARRNLAQSNAEHKHELRIGTDVSTFNYTDPAEDGLLSLTSHWTSRFTTTFSGGFYHRFSEHAENLAASASLRVTNKDWITIGGAAANHQAIIPQKEAFFEYEHVLRFSNRWVKGLEASYQQHWFWYEGAHILTLKSTQLYYLPRDWTWSITITGARSGFPGTGVEWVPSGMTRLGIPLHPKLTANLVFANGAENFAVIDQVGHFSARTFAGGLKYSLAAGRDMTGYVARQDRSDGRSQNSFGVSYGFHF